MWSKKNDNTLAFTIKFTIILIFLQLIFCVNSLLALSPEIVLKNIEKITPELIENNIYYLKPKNFAKNNNLRKKPGSPFFAKGEPLIIEGFVFDLFGVPIENTVLKIWQANYFGYYNYLVKNKTDYSKYDLDFESTGISVTDNAGHYVFFTIIPGYDKTHAPHINFLITNNEFNTLETMMFFEKHPKNLTDNQYRAMSRKNRGLLTCKIFYIDDEDHSVGKKCIFNIYLNGIHRRKRY